jgi:hypothetical protein
MTRATHAGGTLLQNMSIACCVARALRVEWFRETCVREVWLSQAVTTCKRNGTSNSANSTADSLQTTRLQRTTSLLDKFAAVLRFATNRELTHEHERLHEHEHEHDSDPHEQLLCSGQRRGDPLQRQHWTIDVVDNILLGIIRVTN